MKYLEYLFSAILSAMLIFSCERVRTDDIEDSSEDYIHFSLATKDGGEVNRTYCASFYTPFYEYQQNSGFYCIDRYVTGVKGNSWNEPCAVDAEGGYTQYDCSKGLRYNYINGSGPLYLCMVSPAFAPEKYTVSKGDFSENELYGYRQSRVRLPDEVQYVSNPLSVTLRGIYLDNQEVFHADSIKLKEHRSKLSVAIACGDDISSVTVRSIEMADVYGSAYYNFFHGYQAPVIDTVMAYQPDAPKVFHTGETAEQVMTDFYLLSNDYSRTDEYGAPYYTVPQMLIAIGAEEDGPVIKIPLTYDFKPQYQYDLTVIVNSVYLSLHVSALPWDVSPDSGDVVENPPAVTILYSFEGWENGGSDSGTIETLSD